MARSAFLVFGSGGLLSHGEGIRIQFLAGLQADLQVEDLVAEGHGADSAHDAGKHDDLKRPAPHDNASFSALLHTLLFSTMLMRSCTFP